MAMDQTDKMGLGVAVGGHILLLGAMMLGLFMSTERLKKPEPIAVSLIGDVAEVSTAPDAIQEESAPPAAGEVEPVEPPPSRVIKMEKPVEKPQIKPVEKPAKRDVPIPTKAAVKKVPVKQPPAKTKAAATKSGKGTTSSRPGGLSKSFEDSINNVGKAPGAGKAVGTPAMRSAAVIRSAASNTIGAEVKPYIPPCAPRTSDNSSLKVFVALNIGTSGNLLNANVYKLLGETPSNAAQIPQMKQCVLDSLRAASPYNLNPAEFDTWKNHKVQLEVNFK